MNNWRLIWLVVILANVLQRTLGQGFLNLDFESADLSAYGNGAQSVPTITAIPYWTAYAFGNPRSDVWFNGIYPSGSGVCIENSNNPFGLPQVQGGNFIVVQGSNSRFYVGSAAIGQTGQIPSWAMSMILWGAMGTATTNVTFNGVFLPLSLTSVVYDSSGTNYAYAIYSADVSTFAGQTGELRFTAYANQVLLFDNIQFSTSPVPEPSVISLFGICTVFLCWVIMRPPKETGHKR